MSNRKTPIQKTCPKCGTNYKVHPSMAKRKYCSKKCFDEAQTTSERKEIKCAECGKLFITAQDHGKWPKFCSRDCFKKGAAQPTYKVCPVCGDQFLADRSSHNTVDGLRIYCSKKCSVSGLRKGVEKECINCGGTYYLSNSTAKKRNDLGCCSNDCRSEYYIGDRSHSWKGGKYIDTTTNTNRIYFPDNPTVTTHWAEHRVIASEAIGRMLTGQEFVIHINGDNMDNRKSNLYVCSNSEFSKMRQGSLAWPKASNLDEYR